GLRPPSTSVQVDQEHRDIGRGDARDPRRLPDRTRPDGGKLLLRLLREAGDRPIISAFGNPLLFEPAETLDLLFLLRDVPRVLHLNFHLLAHLRGLEELRQGRPLPTAKGGRAEPYQRFLHFRGRADTDRVQTL